MNVLIIGLGYAGTRFVRAFHFLSAQYEESINIAYVDKYKKNSELIFYIDINEAITNFKPHIIVVSVNDEFHAEVLHKLAGYTGFIICEKPLITPKDSISLISKHLRSISGFCMDLIERYSEITTTLKNYVHAQQLKLLRANFHWGKDRINDHRPTSGVVSEIIHSLDLIQYIADETNSIEINTVIGNRSDFSISGTEILDSVALTAKLGSSVITGYSSFVNIVRRREIEMTFLSPNQKLIYANMIFDTPEWDIDYLRVWERTAQGEKLHLELQPQFTNLGYNLKTIQKLVLLVKDVIDFVKYKKQPCRPFPNLQTALTLQELLNTIENTSQTTGPVQYVVNNKREFLNDENDLERLG